MKMSSLFCESLQLLLIAQKYKGETVTSNFVATKTGAHPGLLRQIMVDLKRAGLIQSKPGPGGITLLKDLNEISLYDLYQTVTNEDENVLKFNDLPEEASEFEEKIISTSNEYFSQFINPFYTELKRHTVGEIYRACEESL